MASLAEVKQSALELLGVIRLGQSARNQDDVRIGKAYTQVYEDLKTEGLATWAVAGTIPDGIAPHLEAMMARNAMDTFGVSDARAARILARTGQMDMLAKREIRTLVTPDYESLAEPEDF